MYKFILLIFVSLVSFTVLSDTKILGIDVRTWAERKVNPAEGSEAISRGELKEELLKRKVSKDKEIVVFCEAGKRAEKAKTVLKELGYKNVTNIGSWREWNRDYGEQKEKNN